MNKQRKYLLTDSKNYYKSNLHNHSTISDGAFTPEELKKLYMEKGYSVLAYTDHDILVAHHELTDEKFVALSGVELDINPNVEYHKGMKTCHIGFIALEQGNDFQPCYHRTKYCKERFAKNRHLVKFDDSLPDYEREYTGECISDMMRIAREKGFFVTYNHPTFSLEDYPIYMSYHNMNAMEIYNTVCELMGYDEHNGHIYDDKLRNGEKIYCIAADDTHGVNDIGGGFTMINADKLEYREITKALEDGNFYASEGPIINNLWYEDGTVHIECEEAQQIFITKGVRNSERKAVTNGYITEVDFNIIEEDIYFRITVVGKDGRKAYTNAYFVDEL